MKASEFLKEYVDTNTPEFKKWFGKSKVVDKNGNPLMVFHGTLSNGQIHTFNSGSHFGTQGAANDRIEDLLNMDPISRGYGQPMDGEESPHVYPLYLKIENPFKMEDCGEWHDSDMWFQIMEHHYDDIVKYLTDNYGEEPEDDHEVVDALVDNEDDPWEFLSDELGYDGIAYENTFEDKGSYSWIVFNGNQVRSAF